MSNNLESINFLYPGLFIPLDIDDPSIYEINQDFFDNLPQNTKLQLLSIKELASKLVKIDGSYLEFVPYSLRTDFNLVFEAVRSNYEAFQFLPQAMKNDKRIILAMVDYDFNRDTEEYPHYPSFAELPINMLSEQHLEDDEIIEAAIRANPGSIVAHARFDALALDEINYLLKDAADKFQLEIIISRLPKHIKHNKELMLEICVEVNDFICNVLEEKNKRGIWGKEYILDFAKPLLRNKKFIIRAAKTGKIICSLFSFDDPILNDGEIIESLFVNNNDVYHGDTHLTGLQINKNSLMRLLKSYNFPWHSLSEEKQLDKDLFCAALAGDPHLLFDNGVSDELKMNPQHVKTAIQSIINHDYGPYKDIQRCFINDLVKCYPGVIENREWVILLAQCCGTRTLKLAKRYCGDFEIVSLAVRQHGMSLQFASSELQKNKDIVMLAVKEDGMSLKFASSELQKNKDIVMLAVKENGMSLQFADQELQDDPNIVMLAMNEDEDCLQFSNKLLSDKKFILKVLTAHPKCIRFIDKQLQDDCECLQQIMNSEHLRGNQSLLELINLNKPYSKNLGKNFLLAPFIDTDDCNEYFSMEDENLDIEHIQIYFKRLLENYDRTKLSKVEWIHLINLQYCLYELAPNHIRLDLEIASNLVKNDFNNLKRVPSEIWYEIRQKFVKDSSIEDLKRFGFRNYPSLNLFVDEAEKFKSESTRQGIKQPFQLISPLVDLLNQKISEISKV